MYVLKAVKTVFIVALFLATLQAKEGIVIGVKSTNVAKAATAYAPLATLLSESTGYEISVQGFATLDALSNALKSGKVSLSVSSPTDYLKLHESAQAEAIATKLNKGGTPYCQGTIVAAKDKGIASIKDLKGKSICYGPKGSFNKYLAALAAYKKHGIKKEEIASQFGTGCGNIAGHILEGKSDAGVICDYSWDGWVAKSKSEYTDKLVVVGKGPKLRDLAIASSPKAQKNIIKTILTALVALKDKPELLKAPLKAKGFTPSSDADYDALREIVKNL